jgi:DNA recombination protein RmuC
MHDIALVIFLLAALLGVLAYAIVVARSKARAQAIYEKRICVLESELAGRAAEVSGLTARLDEIRSAGDEKVKLLNESHGALKAEFSALAATLLEEKSKSLTEQSQKRLDLLLTPLKEQISEFRKKVEDAYDKEGKDRRGLFEQIVQLKDLNLQLSTDARNLASALKGEAKTQGNWGELALRRILELSGLEKGREFEEQYAVTGANGERYLLDTIVHMPENKDIIIDSKVSLKAYEEYYSATTDETRTAALAGHVASLRSHIKILSSKSYERAQGIRTLDFVLLFVPIEPAYLTALRADDTLYEEAFRKRIILTCPSTLLVALRVIANFWQYERQNQNAELIARRAGDLYDKFVAFAATLDDVGRSITKAGESFETARKQLSSGPGNIIKRIEDFRRMGVNTKKSLPQSLLDSADGDFSE